VCCAGSFSKEYKQIKTVPVRVKRQTAKFIKVKSGKDASELFQVDWAQ
jgi:hypothetical protein